MPALITKLLAMLALVVMPLGMNTAAAAPVHHAPAAATVQHCDDRGGQLDRESKAQVVDCAMACSMLLAAEARVEEPVTTLRLMAAQAVPESATGLHPDTATPPPKLS